MTAPAHGTDRKLTKDEIDDLRNRVTAFMDSDVYPNEGFFHEHNPRRNPAGIAKMKELQAKTKAMGMWAPHLPAEAGGMGKEAGRAIVHGMPSADWKALHHTPATSEQLARMEESMAKNP